MKQVTTHFNALSVAERLDAKYFIGSATSSAGLARSRSMGFESFGNIVGKDLIWRPNRFTQVLASEPSYGKPYLAPWDTLRYIPRSNSILSRTQNPTFHECEVERGWFLATCSGRNLGPCVFVDEVLSRYAISGDMIRISLTDFGDEVAYALAYLNTDMAQQALKISKSGSVIDHLDPKTLQALRVPMFDDTDRKRIAQLFRTATLLRETARASIVRAEEEFAEITGMSRAVADLSKHTYERRFCINRSSLGTRLDAEPHAPLYEAYRTIIGKSGIGTTLDAVAKVTRPPSRYKTNYVTDTDHGVPMLSGRHVAQFRPVGLKYMSRTALQNVDEYLLSENTIVLTADGRSESNLADCAMICYDRAGWASSGHVIRLIPNDTDEAGLLYLACVSRIVQAQLKALATGSVIDGLSESDVEAVLVPYPVGEKACALNRQVITAWLSFAAAKEMEDEAIASFAEPSP